MMDPEYGVSGPGCVGVLNLGGLLPCIRLRSLQ
jgi:hypothetical protein